MDDGGKEITTLGRYRDRDLQRAAGHRAGAGIRRCTDACPGSHANSPSSSASSITCLRCLTTRASRWFSLVFAARQDVTHGCPP